MSPRPPAPDREERDRARLLLGRNAVVEAGAGTGKTTILTDRLLMLLLGGPRPVPVERLVALTFTEKAAGEIKVRLSDRLAAVAARLSGGALGAEEAERAGETLAELRGHFGTSEGDVLERARRALEDMDKAPISTIHAFCAQILRLYPREAGVDPDFAVDEGAFFESLFAERWAAWLDGELGERPPRAEVWRPLLERLPLAQVEALARELCSERAGPGAAPGPDPASAAELRALAEELRRRTEGRPKPSRGKALEAVSRARARLLALAEAAESADPPLDPPELPLPPDAGWPNVWGDDPEDIAVYERALRLSAGAEAGEEALLRLAARAAAPFAAHFGREYARRGRVSFDGLLRRARDLVRDHPSVREELKARFAAILVDEFQDTDPLQGELLLFLSEAPGRAAASWREVVPGPGRLFVVGDPKQSIYRFRGADISAYEGFVARLREAGGAVSCALTANFRCRPAIIERVNAVFARAMRPKPGVQPSYEPLRAARPAGEGEEVELVSVVDPPGRRANAAAANRTEAAWAAEWILERARPGGGPGLLRLRDVAVLLRSGTILPAVLDAFKAAGIPYAVDMKTRLYGAQESVDALNLLRVIADPGDAVSMAGLLRSPAGGLSDEDLLALARAKALDGRGELPDCLEPGARARAAALFTALRELRARAGREPLGELVAAAFARTRLIELCARAYHGQQTASNLLKLRRLAAEASESDGESLEGFIARVAEDERLARAAGESALADESLEAVRVLTVHKSKGLEFPVVLALGLSAKAGRGTGEKAVLSRRDWASGRLALRAGPEGPRGAAMLLFEERDKEREAEETVRLLYVLMTRAKEKLVLCGRSAPKESSLAQRLAEGGLWPEDGGAPARAIVSGSLEGPRVPARAKAAGGRAPAAAGLPAPPPPLPPGPWTVSAAGGGKSLPPPGEEAWASRAERSGADGARVGLVCHRALQSWDPSAPASAAELAAEARRRLEFRDPGPGWARAQAEAEGILEAFLGSAAARRLYGAEVLARELPLRCGQDGAVLRGAADLVLRLGGRLVVADFKSERVDEAGAAASRERHAAQGRAYAQALRAAWGEEPEFLVVFLRRPDL